ncbi:MAG: cobalamin B12-binding domain-containing protein [Deltaproteobacteria bacterium]|nr:cobalamin B12-binding domain-containing protein [Deltaproteobacteria bacterium]
MVREREKPIKILLAKVGLDGHDRGIVILSKALMDSGMEVIYLGAYRKVKEVVQAALQEDVDAIGLSFLGGEHLIFSEKMLGAMKEKNMSIPLLVGGVIPREDLPDLKRMGVKDVIISGVPLETIRERITEVVLKEG